MTLRAFQGHWPQVDPSAFIEESAQVVGDVVIGPRSSVWFNSVLRGDVNFIRIGAETNIQDLCCLHVTRERFSLTVGDRVTVGHSVTLHGCQVGSLCLIGMGATVLDGVHIGEGCLVGAGALLVPGTRVPAGSLVLGAPAKVVRPLGESERQMLIESAEHYAADAELYRHPGK